VIYRVSHRTSYRYDEAVTASYGQIRLLPRTEPGQICHESTTKIEPPPADQTEHDDFFGNRTVYFEIAAPHRELTVTTDSLVEIDGRQAHLSLLADQPWEDVLAGRTRPDTSDFALDSPLATVTPPLADYAAPSFPPRRPVLDALLDLGSRIHGDMAYLPGATSVRTSAAEALAGQAGVCQDFAHVMIACLRSLGWPARYISGYLETDPPPGQPRLVGRDVSHAWASLLVAEVGWVDYDPTNRQLVHNRYIVAAKGRDYSDVPPLKGVIFTNGTKHELEVSVDVVRRNQR
jgi:transglutaminase-like putative cysteine protease